MSNNQTDRGYYDQGGYYPPPPPNSRPPENQGYYGAPPGHSQNQGHHYPPTPQPQTIVVQQPPPKKDNSGLCWGCFSVKLKFSQDTQDIMSESLQEQWACERCTYANEVSFPEKFP
ncbi:9120_t:CDS:2, partial [Acaulospora morrowiae]